MALDAPDDPLWTRFGSGARERVRALRHVGSKQVNPVLLSAAVKFNPKEMVRLLHLMEVLSVRYQLIVAGRTGPLEIASARLAQKIWKGEVTTARDAFSQLSSVYPSDEDFRAEFRKKSGLTNQKSAYLLKRIAAHERRRVKGAEAEEFDPGQDLTLEHIFPKNAGEEWQAELATDPVLLEDGAGRLGNMCLLTEARNREAQRRHFMDKVHISRRSHLLTTRKISEFSVWNMKSIDTRQAWLASRAVSEWRFD